MLKLIEGVLSLVLVLFAVVILGEGGVVSKFILHGDELNLLPARSTASTTISHGPSLERDKFIAMAEPFDVELVANDVPFWYIV